VGAVRDVHLYYMRYTVREFTTNSSQMYLIRYMDFPQTGLVIRGARKQAGLTQAELARRLGMSRATISQLENGVIADLGIRKLAKIADRLGLEMVVRPRRPLTLHEAYARNREQRKAALRETDAILANLNPGQLGG
jgi:HTH-type transcriptional regulator/antitoxin HipB